MNSKDICSQLSTAPKKISAWKPNCVCVFKNQIASASKERKDVCARKKASRNLQSLRLGHMHGMKVCVQKGKIIPAFRGNNTPQALRQLGDKKNLRRSRFQTEDLFLEQGFQSRYGLARLWSSKNFIAAQTRKASKQQKKDARFFAI